jgi:ABC-type glycerol-3-phosphate transport system substrate-binding protein
MKTRITAILLAALMLMSSLVACGGKTETPEATTAAQNENIDGDNTTTTPAETEPPAPTVEDLLGFKQTDYNQYEFHMLIAQTDEYEHLAETLTGDLVNDAVYARNTQVEEFFNIDLQIKSMPCAWADRQAFTAEVSNQVMAGDPTWDMVVGQSAVMCTGMNSQYYLNIAEMPSIDFAKPWWISDLYEKLEINGKLFGAYGDMNLSLYGDMHGIFFSSTIITENKMENPYELVKNNQWTLEKMLQMAEQASAELDGTAGASKTGDRLGIIAIDNPMRAFGTCLGCEVVTRGEDGGLVFPAAPSERHIDFYTRMSNAFADGSYNLKFKNDTYEESLQILAENRALFVPSYLNYISNEILRNMESDFGILPYPKYDESQEAYISQIATGATCTCFPQNIANPELSAQVTSYMGYLGRESLVGTYFETYLQERLSRTPEMQDMLNLIRETATANLTTVYAALFSPNLVTWFEVSGNIDHGTTLVSKFKANAGPAKKILEKNIMPRFE